MSDDLTESPGTIPFEVANRIDQICDGYEAELVAGRGPRIEAYLEDIPAAARSGLLRELLALELDWRRRRGDRPALQEYCERFPSEAALISALLRDSTASGAAQTQRPSSPDDGSSGIQPGDRPLPGYRLLERLGQGGFGEVWKAEAPGGVLVALKFVRLTGGQGTLETRALETIKGIRHPNLLALFGAWQREGLLIIGMELADGTLADRFHQARAEGRPGIPARELIEALAEAAKGIDYLNRHIHKLEGRERVGVQHRDIKPQNILLVGGGVKVADFGLVRLLDQSVTEHSGCLTPSFAAPEFFQNRTSDQSDQYSLAVTYCYLRGGRLPFTGGAAAVMAGHLLHPPDLSMVPESERSVLARALAKEPAERWSSCRAFVAALEKNLGAAELPGLAPTVDLVSKPTAGAFPTRVGPAWRFLPGRSKRVSAGLATFVLTLVAASLMPGRPRPRPGPVPPQLTARRNAPPKTEQASVTVPRKVREFARPRGDPTTRVRPTPESKSGPPLRSDPSEPQGSTPANLEPNTSVARAPGAPSIAGSVASHLDRGLEHYDRRNFGEAIYEYSEAIALDPASVTALNNRGNAYLKLEHYAAAVADYGRAIQLSPKDHVGYYNRGNAYFKMNRAEEAIRDYSHAIALTPNLADAYANRALAYDRIGDRVRAQADRDQARALESGLTGNSPPHP